MNRVLLFIFLSLIGSVGVFAQCNTCFGQGTVIRTETCTHCQGKGSFTENIVKDCPVCYGQGYKNEACSVCSGLGVVPGSNTCTTCKGERSVSNTIKCQLCNGSGGEFYLNSLGESNVRPCSKCKGAKYVEALVPCATCNGNGVVPTSKTCSKYAKSVNA